MQCSVIRSVVSVDDSRREMHGGEYDLSMEVNRLTRKNGLLERSKQVLEEELAIYKQEIASKNRRIQQLSRQIENNSFGSVESEIEGVEVGGEGVEYSSWEVILCEKEEQIGYVTALLKEKTKHLQEVIEENKQLRDEIASKNELITRIKESARAQVTNQTHQIHRLEKELQEKVLQIGSTKIFYENLAQKESIKAQKVNDSLKERLRMMEEEKECIISEQQSQKSNITSLKEENQQLLRQISKQKQTIEWLQSLLQQAKGEFINVHLKQQQRIEKQQRQKRQFQKRNQLLKTQLKNYKKEAASSNDTSTIQPNRSTRTASRLSITPFRIKSKHSRFSDQPQ